MAIRANKQAILAKCVDCIYDPKCRGGTPTQQVGKCTSIDCPIWPFRTGPRGVDIPRDPKTVSRAWLESPVSTPNLLPYAGGHFDPIPVEL